jgi:Tfp pilus assembly protein PilX
MRLSRLRHQESGFALISVLLGIVTASLVVAVAVTAVNGDIRIGKRDLDRKQAYAAAQAGLADYIFHLNKDTDYWSKCTNVPTPNAVNQQGSTARRRSVPGSTTATYAIELIPASGQSSCSQTNPVQSMIETTGQAVGTFRIRSTGFVNCAANQTSGGSCTTQKIVATFKRSSFLDYVYFTQLETSDPVTYGDQNTINGAYQQCTKTIAQGRYSAPIPNSGGKYCDTISFIDGEQINGPLHTNDALVICGRPYFGRTAADAIEVSSPPRGWFSNCSSWNDQPIFRGTYVTNSAVLTPPPTNTALANVPGVLSYSGQTKIVLSGTNMTVTNNGTTSTVPIPTSGVVYIDNGTCSAAYNPFTATYPPTSTCGNALVSGSYSKPLTIAAENDIIIEDDITKSSTTPEAILGLIANNFIRVKHPICASTDLGCTNGTVSRQTAKGSCNSGVNGTGTNSNLRIDAALLAIAHSFIVDHYDCGADLGTLTVNGAISQKFRGAVGTFGGWGGGTGYEKNYNYDDRLRYISPPRFLDPVQSSWHMQRQTLDN